MPTYQYRCTECGNEVEAVQKFTDPSLTVCPECQGALRKVYSAVGVVFKGSGFYATDNRAKHKSATGASEKADKTDKPEKAEKAEKAEKKHGKLEKHAAEKSSEKKSSDKQKSSSTPAA